MLTDKQAMGEHGTCETIAVKLKNHNGADAVINAHDFNPDEHDKVEMAAVVVSAVEDQSRSPFDDMRKDELKKWLDEKNVGYNADASKSELAALCKAHAA